LYTRDFERWMKEGSGSGASLSEAALWEEPGGRAPWLGTLKDMLSKALEMGICFHRGPTFGEHVEMFLSWGLKRRGKKSLYSGDFLWGIWETCEDALWTGSTLHRGHCWGTCRGFLTERENAYLGSFFLDLEEIKS
jgi:hypothetical protein